MNKDVKIILERIHENFKRVPNTIYKINVVDDKFDKTYNFFIYIAKRGKRPHSIPLRTIKNYDMDYLQEVISGIKEHYQLTFTYTGFIDYLDV
ncbi:hypothetical protein GBP13_08485 [Pediococcus acidilactici]|uniref:hypothetical protein n=1 Tax=Pediococcus acidilactici TaxID=1254 RepID=UPI001327DCDA|nr:hypothetical protein [Pediococcus acidilactici]KAF0362518.1 hypothetical protein GBO50_08480 [Pediococcus acidilactici]KAF0368103.1 hypothetical protein GBO55_03030 [Pediococcus acidilactici]KAF0417222.1 hypothetical protein GBO80_08480 [Pediococcus acidilactici]KAF0420650.1 hypothetical protein GBO82_08475 [Pediococcus acidilactici]KAF0472791.1 hypothetical protein GBP08_08485 [Pediococcus acidilactici]